MLLTADEINELNGLLAKSVADNRITSPDWTDPARMIGTRADEALLTQFNLMPKPRLLSGEAKLSAGTGVEHRRRSDVAGASNTGADAWGGTRFGTSLNWSGALVAARDGRKLTTVAARWRVPSANQVRLPQGAAPDQPPPDGANAYKVSIWVGLDGHRTASPSMPQVGTTVALEYDKGNPACVQGTDFVLSSYAWMQWWVLGKDAMPGYIEVKLDDFAMSPGDVVSCSLFTPKPNEAFIRIVNETQGNAAKQYLWADKPDLSFVHPADRTKDPVAGAAACFVVERPAVHRPRPAATSRLPFRPDLYALPDFGTVTFMDCWVAEKPVDDLAPQVAMARGLTSCRLIRMFDQCRAPYRAAIRATPVRDPMSDTLTVSYRA